jgi:hypothetical protein
MTLIRRRPRPTGSSVATLITLKEAAEMLRLDESTLRKGRAGTAHLTLIRQGTGRRQPIFLLLEEVEAHVASLVANARRLNSIPEAAVFER